MSDQNVHRLSNEERVAKVQTEKRKNDFQMAMLSAIGVLAFLLAFWLKLEDRKKHYGLELPNIKK